MPSLFFINTSQSTQIYTLSLHDALPISSQSFSHQGQLSNWSIVSPTSHRAVSIDANLILGSYFTLPQMRRDRKSTRLNSSHVAISYAVFCLKKKKNTLNDKINLV